MKRSLVFVALVLALLPVSSYGQTRKPAKPAPGIMVKVSDFDSSIVYRRCDPLVRPTAQRRVWQFPGISPMVPPQLLRKAGLDGRDDLDFVRAVVGNNGENSTAEQREALNLVQSLIRLGLLQALDDPDDAAHTWEDFQDLVRSGTYKRENLALACADSVGTMTFAGGFKTGTPTVMTRTGYVLGFTPSPQAWRVGPMKTRHGWKMVDVILECFNIRPVDTAAPAIVIPPPPPPPPPAPALVVPPVLPPLLPPPSVKKKRGFSCGPAKVYCWGPPLAAGIIYAATRDHHKEPRRLPEDNVKIPTPLPPRP